MAIQVLEKMNNNSEIKRMQAKAAIFDELVDLIEDKYLGYLMSAAEKEKPISLLKAKKMLRG